MKLRDLLDQLNEIATEHGEEIEVRMAQQPSWPFEYSFEDEVKVVTQVTATRGDELETVVMFIEGEQIRYLTEEASKEIGWSK